MMLPILMTLMSTELSPEPAPKLYDLAVTNIDGEKVNLAKFKGKALLVVNVASFCGYTRQYEGLEALHREYKDKGLVVMGFPANDFGSQEPGTEKEIKEFCTRKFDVTFPMFSKVPVVGEKKAPLFRYLIENSDRPKDEVRWNFEKFVVNRKGEVVGRFKSGVEPTSPELKKAILAALG
ncbi:MAG: glutathione peroxidase [Fimbriimonadaceae bacterium]|nr:glutathione peroxidase [Fimbriimonadaceae bacterium]